MSNNQDDVLAKIESNMYRHRDVLLDVEGLLLDFKDSSFRDSMILMSKFLSQYLYETVPDLLDIIMDLKGIKRENR